MLLPCAALRRCYVFSGDNREALSHKAGTYCAKLLKRTDQCLAVLSCSHLHWQAPAEVHTSVAAALYCPVGVLP